LDAEATSVLLTIPGFGSPEKTSEPIGSLGSLADYQLATPKCKTAELGRMAKGYGMPSKPEEAEGKPSDQHEDI
jgi:hypothetical protein